MTTTYDDDPRPSPTATVREYDYLPDGSLDCPRPGDSILGGIVVASTHYSDDYAFPIYTVALLMPESPFYRVGTVWGDPAGYRWETIPYAHFNIVPAVAGEYMGAINKDHSDCGYCDLGGDI